MMEDSFCALMNVESADCFQINALTASGGNLSDTVWMVLRQLVPEIVEAGDILEFGDALTVLGVIRVPKLDG